MKNKKILSLTVLSLALTLLFPVFASANSFKSEVAWFGFGDDEDKVNVSVGAEMSSQNNDDDEDNADDKDNSSVKVESKTNVEVSDSDDDDADIPNGIEKKIESDSSSWKNGWFNIFRKWFGWTGTSTTSVSLFVKDIEVANVSTSTAEIKWSTNPSTTSEIRYGTNASLTNSTLVTLGTLLTNHSTKLVGLTSNTKYYFQITAKDGENNTKTSGILNFTTKPDGSVDTKAPGILFSSVLNVGTDSARIVWVTNELSDSKVWVSTNSTVSTSGTETAGSSVLSYMHDVKVSGLTSDSKYYYKFLSADANANVAVSAVGTFTTE